MINPSRGVPILQKDPVPFINFRDLAIGGVISMLASASLALPDTRWPDFAAWLARFTLARRGGLSSEQRSMIAIIVGDKPDIWIDRSFWPKVLAHKYLSWMQILACHQPRRWRPSVAFIGRDHVDRALDLGRGVMLFTATFAYKDLMAKAAFADAGYAISHLSRDTHGFSETQLGKRWLNPIYTSIEERYLRERLVFSGGNTKLVTARLKERLAQNEPVMITVTPLGRQTATLPFLNGQIHIATGGLKLACEQETPVLPVFSLQQSDGSFATYVGSALHQPKVGGPTEKIEAMLGDYVPRLETTVLCHPDQFSFPLSDQFGQPLLSRMQSAPEELSQSITEKSAA